MVLIFSYEKVSIIKMLLIVATLLKHKNITSETVCQMLVNEECLAKDTVLIIHA
jgi:hypothetical protein